MKIIIINKNESVETSVISVNSDERLCKPSGIHVKH